MKNNEIELPSNKNFGIFFSIIFLTISIYSYFYLSIFIAFTFLIISLFFGICSYFRPDILKSLNNTWMQLALLLNKIVSPIVLGFIFYILITPISLIGYLCGRDELRIKNLNKDSYWIDRKQLNSEEFSFYNQF